MSFCNEMREKNYEIRTILFFGRNICYKEEAGFFKGGSDYNQKQEKYTYSYNFSDMYDMGNLKSIYINGEKME